MLVLSVLVLYILVDGDDDVGDDDDGDDTTAADDGDGRDDVMLVQAPVIAFFPYVLNSRMHSLTLLSLTTADKRSARLHLLDASIKG